MLEAIKQLTANIPEEAFKTFTSDRGKEFSCWEEVEKMGIDFYFADPYCSWQRGCNENSNGLLREFYPKKTNISKVETENLIRTLMLINSRPRKCLNYVTLFEKFLHEISFLKKFGKMSQLILQFMYKNSCNFTKNNIKYNYNNYFKSIIKQNLIKRK